MDAYEFLNESVVSFNSQGLIRGWNEASCRLYGRGRDEAIGANVRTLLEDGSSDWETRLLGSDRWEGEATRMTASGFAVVQLRWAARRQQSGEVVEIIETARAAIELSSLRQERKNSTYRYENLFQALAVGFFETDFRRVGAELMRLRDSGVEDLKAYLLDHPDYVRELMDLEDVIEVNSAAVKLFAASDASDLRGPRSRRYWPDESIPDYVGALTAVMDKRPHFICETRLRALDGRAIDALFTVAWSPESAKRGKMIVGVIDLGDRNRAFEALQQSETKYRNLFAAMSVGFVEFDFAAADALLDRYRKEGVVELADHLVAEPARMVEMIEAIHVVSANDRALEIFGIDRTAQVGTGAGWLWTPSGYPVVARAVEGRYRKVTMPPVDIRIQRLDGREIDVTFTIWAEPERRSDQPVLCGIVDISDRVESQQRLERVRTEFAHASRIATLGELAASVAHEISQPLSAVISNTEIGLRTLGRAPLDSVFLESLMRHTLSAGRRAADIVSTIRSVAAPTAPARTLLSMNDVVQEALSFVDHELQQGCVSRVVDLAPDLPLVEGDRVQLQQVVVNLVLNAAQALQEMPTNRRCVKLTTFARGGDVHLAVEDTGMGFPKEDEQRLFDSFYTTKSTGMGIGLAICRSIMESLGGRIEAFSLGSGARFVVSVPVMAEQAADEGEELIT